MTLLAGRELASRLWARDMRAVRARLGVSRPSEHATRIWLHAASNGELTSVRPVIEALLAEGHRLLITANTDSAVRMAQNWQMNGAEICLAPLDLRGATRQVMRNWGIIAHITVESDLWPIRILETSGPVLVLGGRLTERSAKGWARFDGLVRRVMDRVTFLSAQDSASAGRFASAGLRQVAMGPVFDLKALYSPPSDAPDATLSNAFDRAHTWLAASTHDGEENIILAAHKLAQQARPALKLILAPRHPKRADEIAKLIPQRGLSCARRSHSDDPSRANVYLADTFGEMHLWYALAGVTFVAGSLTDRGGHTPYEPAAFQSAILHGPDTANFRAAYARLRDADAAICVQDATALAQAVISLDTADAQQSLGRAAQRALRQDTNFESLLRDITKALDA